ncbi:MAG: thiamine pyrophosphate-binding protein [Kiloniellales bacterium]
MSKKIPTRSGGRILVDQLRIHGVEMAFGVPGESYLAVLDALHDTPDLRFVVCRQEGGAAMMAEAYGKLTGRPGVCMVTRGPGATNASPGLHIAFQDSTPMILLVGQVGRDMIEREAFQEIDYRRLFGQVAKWVAEIDDPARIPELVSRAFHTAVNGRPGPVVLALPEDMLREPAAVADAGPYARSLAHPGPAEMAKLRALLEEAERPFVIVGGGGWDQTGVADIQAFAEANDLPVGVSFRCQDHFDNRHPNYAGDVGIGVNPKLAERISGCNLLIAAGPRLGEMTTGGYSLLKVPRPSQRLVHVHPDPEELGRVYQPVLAINAAPPAFAAAARRMAPLESPRWRDWTRQMRRAYEENIVPPDEPGDVDLGKVVKHLTDVLPEEAIVTNGAGNYTAWVHRYYQYRAFRSQLGPTCGSMGYGTPAAVAAKLLYPEKPVIAFAGDGCFLMNGQELATAVQYEAAIVVIVVNNSMYGTIRMHQERAYPGRVSGTDLRNPDFVALAKAYGASGERVTRTADFPAAFERATKAGRPALIELVTDKEAISPRATLSGVRKKALAGAKG